VIQPAPQTLRKIRDLTPTIVRLYRDSGWTIRQISEHVHLSYYYVVLALHKAEIKIRSNSVPKYAPTPEEIAERAAEVRERWSNELYRIRAGRNAPVPVEGVVRVSSDRTYNGETIFR